MCCEQTNLSAAWSTTVGKQGNVSCNAIFTALFQERLGLNHGRASSTLVILLLTYLPSLSASRGMCTPSQAVANCIVIRVGASLPLSPPLSSFFSSLPYFPLSLCTHLYVIFPLSLSLLDAKPLSCRVGPILVRP